MRDAQAHGDRRGEQRRRRHAHAPQPNGHACARAARRFTSRCIGVNFSVYYKRLDPEAYRLLLALRDGATLEDACATAFAGSKELPEKSAARIQEWFARWMEFGWFCRREVGSPLAMRTEDLGAHPLLHPPLACHWHCSMPVLFPGQPGIYELEDQSSRPGGRAAADRRPAAHRPERRHLRPDAKCRHGLGTRPGATIAQFLILSTAGGMRAPDGKPIALGYHTGHWEIWLLVEAAARELRALGAVPFAGTVSDPCDGRTQGTTGMFDSLPYRNDAAMVLRRLIRSLPRRAGVIGIATCDKGLPAMMMALAAMHDLPGVIVPGGVTLPPSDGEDAGKVQTIGARYSARHALPEGSRRTRLPRLRFARRRLPVPRHRRHLASRRRSARHGAAAQRAGAQRSAGLAGNRHAVRARASSQLADRALPMRDILTPGGHPQRHDRARGLRRLHQSPPPHPRHRPCRRPPAPDGRGLDRGQSRHAAPRRCAAERPGRPSHRARLPRRRRARSDAASRRARACSTPACSPPPA